MSNYELEIIVRILEYKSSKSEHILFQRYSEAASARDSERVYEYKLISFLGHDFKINDDLKNQILDDYFFRNLGIKYEKKIDKLSKKNILRNLKLIKLGI